MAGPPLQLEESFFDTVNVEVVPDYVPDSESRPQQHGVEIRLNLATVDDDPGVWRVTLDVTDKDVEGATPRYHYRLRIIGFFRWVGGERPEQDVAQIIAANGASILYSSAREYLLMLTSRTPWGQVTLPTMSFADVAVTPDGAAGSRGARHPGS